MHVAAKLLLHEVLQIPIVHLGHDLVHVPVVFEVFEQLGEARQLVGCEGVSND